MTYRWIGEVQPGSTLSDAELQALGIGKQFPDQQSAELWLSDFFADLLDAGLASVSLMEEDRLVYGPMSLSAD